MSDDPGPETPPHTVPDSEETGTARPNIPQAETLVVERAKGTSNKTQVAPRTRKFDLDKLWPAIPGGSWPPGFTVSREQIYDEFGRLTGGPQTS